MVCRNATGLAVTDRDYPPVPDQRAPLARTLDGVAWRSSMHGSQRVAGPVTPRAEAVIRGLRSSWMFAVAVDVCKCASPWRPTTTASRPSWSDLPCCWSWPEPLLGQQHGGGAPPRLLASAAKGSPDMHSDVLDLVPSPPDPYPLRGWLFCKCGQAFFRWRRVDSTREYLSLCGCRLWPIDADSIERRVYAAVAKSVQGSIVGGRTDRPAEVFMSLIARIEVGGTLDDVRLIQRT